MSKLKYLGEPGDRVEALEERATKLVQHILDDMCLSEMKFSVRVTVTCLHTLNLYVTFNRTASESIDSNTLDGGHSMQFWRASSSRIRGCAYRALRFDAIEFAFEASKLNGHPYTKFSVDSYRFAFVPDDLECFVTVNLPEKKRYFKVPFERNLFEPVEVASDEVPDCWYNSHEYCEVLQ